MKPADRQEVHDFVHATGGGMGRFSNGHFRQSKPAKSEIPELQLAFGRIKFPHSEQPACYVKVPWKFPKAESEETISAHPQVLLHFVENVWKLSRPKLLISITGGALDFPLRGDDVLHKLMEAARSTDAWLVTGGTNVGIMKYVGKFRSPIVNINPKICFELICRRSS
jgi:hypothetical protein